MKKASTDTGKRAPAPPSALPSTGWIDVSVPLRTGMVHWPGDPDVVLRHRERIADGDRCNVTTMEMGAHTGTHMDAPLHFLGDGKSLNDLPLSAIIGPARVIGVDDPVSIRPEHLKPYAIRRGERIVFKTNNSKRCWNDDAFVEDYVYIAQDAARYLADRRVRTVGIDYLSVGGYPTDGLETHLALLGAEIWLIEGLQLASIKPGHYDMICLPMKLDGRDGAPARVVLRKR